VSLEIALPCSSPSTHAPASLHETALIWMEVSTGVCDHVGVPDEALALA